MEGTMKNILRLIVGFLYVSPFFILIYVSAVFIGRKKSIAFWGAVFNFMITKVVEILLIPKIKTPDDFHIFSQKIKRNLLFIKPLYDVSINYSNSSKIVMRYNNCPHCQAFMILGLSEICPLICKSDWDIADKNSKLWDFDRTHQIGTGDKYCNHTYIKKA
jgi:hypothetical protein